MAEENIKLFENVINNLQTTHNKLKDNEGACKEEADFKLETFWIVLTASVKELQHEVTKLVLVCSEPPYPELASIESILATIESHNLKALTIFFTLPKEKGLILHKDIQDAVIRIEDCLISLIQSLKENGVRIDQDQITLSRTKWVWDACDCIDNLPRDNLQATSKLLQREEAVVLDAVQEIEGEVKAMGLGQSLAVDELDNTETWSNQDRELLLPCVGLVKTTRSCLKRLGATVSSKGACTTAEQVAQLDQVAQAAKGLSPAVDDLATSVYPPMDRNAVRNAAMVVVNLVQSILELARQSHYVTADDHSWLDFLLKAVDHNNNKLQPLLLP